MWKRIGGGGQFRLRLRAAAIAHGWSGTAAAREYHACMGSAPERRHAGLLQRHSLGLGVAAIVALWFWLYVRGDPATRWGAFTGNALADWLGTLLIVVATSATSRPSGFRCWAWSS